MKKWVKFTIFLVILIFMFNIESIALESVADIEMEELEVNELIGGSVTIDGTLTYGSKLTSKIKDTNPKSSYSYQWYTNTKKSVDGGSEISGATGSSLKLTSKEFNKYVFLVVTATKDGYETKTFVSNVTENPIGKMPIMITAGSASKIYDGTPLTNEKFTLNKDLPVSHTLECKMSSESTITEVGSVKNVIETVNIYGSTGTRVNKYYDITLRDGTLTIKEVPEEKKELTRWEKAFKEVAYAYYMRGKRIQYNSRKISLHSPEECTEQNINYSVCSRYAVNIYRELFGISIPYYTAESINYAREYLGNPEVIGYGVKQADGKFLWYKNKEEYVVNPTQEDILKEIKRGDIFTYTGHSVVIYDLVYNELGDVVDAYIINCISGGEVISSKITPKTIIDGVKYDLNTHKLFYRDIENDEFEEGLFEGSIELKSFKEIKNFGFDGSETSEYSLLRFITEDEDGNLIINYDGTNYRDKKYENQKINLTNSTEQRLKYNKIYIEKTVDKMSDNVVKINDELTYKITVKNNSEKDYTDSINIIENLPNCVEYISQTCSLKSSKFVEKSKTLTWDIGKLEKGQEVTVTYTVKIKNGNIGDVIKSTGTVADIPSGTIQNKIAVCLDADESNKIKASYEKLKTLGLTGKELINEIYKDALNIDLKLTSLKIDNLIYNKSLTSTLDTSIKLNKNNEFYPYVLNKYWSTLYVKQPIAGSEFRVHDLKLWGSDLTNEDRRQDNIYGGHFKTGDILIYLNSNDVLYSGSSSNLKTTPVTNENGEYAYIYIEGKGFVGVNFGEKTSENDKIDHSRNSFNYKYYEENGLKLFTGNTKINDDEDLLEFLNYQTLFGKNYYVILRPSLAIDFTKTELKVEYTQNDKTVLVCISSNEEIQEVDGWELSADKKQLSKTYSESKEEIIEVKDLGNNINEVEIKVEVSEENSSGGNSSSGSSSGGSSSGGNSSSGSSSGGSSSSGSSSSGSSSGGNSSSGNSSGGNSSSGSSSSGNSSGENSEVKNPIGENIKEETSNDKKEIYYKDLKEDDWFYEAVKYVTEKNIMNGTGDDTFSPNLTATRAMIVTILWRIAGEKAGTGTLKFHDVENNMWYTQAIDWAASNGLVNGVSENEFCPNVNITREQFITMLYRFEKMTAKTSEKTEKANISHYIDAVDISDYAFSAFEWGYQQKIINGRTEDTLVPKGNATRAEIATMIMRYINN